MTGGVEPGDRLTNCDVAVGFGGVPTGEACAYSVV